MIDFGFIVTRLIFVILGALLVSIALRRDGVDLDNRLIIVLGLVLIGMGTDLD